METSTTLKPGDEVNATFFVNASMGWKVGTTDHGGMLVSKTVDGALDFVHFTDALHGEAGNSTLKLRTSDGGATWARVR